MRDLHSNIQPAVAFATAAISSNTTTNGAVIDMQGFEAIEFVILSATLTDGTYTPLIEHDDASGFGTAEAVADAELLGTEAAAAFSYDTDDNAVKRIGYIGTKRYVRLSIVSAGTSSGGTLSAIAVKAKPSLAPVA